MELCLYHGVSGVSFRMPSIGTLHRHLQCRGTGHGYDGQVAIPQFPRHYVDLRLFEGNLHPILQCQVMNDGVPSPLRKLSSEPVAGFSTRYNSCCDLFDYAQTEYRPILLIYVLERGQGFLDGLNIVLESLKLARRVVESLKIFKQKLYTVQACCCDPNQTCSNT